MTNDIVPKNVSDIRQRANYDESNKVVLHSDKHSTNILAVIFEFIK